MLSIKKWPLYISEVGGHYISELFRLYQKETIFDAVGLHAYSPEGM